MKRTLTRLALTMGVIGAAMSVDAKPYAIFHTEKGDIVAELYPDKSPKTVENFIGLATGKKTWQHPETKEVMTNKPLYNETKFHRTIANFMIQGGDPLGNGQGGPGYTFPDERNELKFSTKGRLAMANRGPNTNGSQFFITVAPTPQLDNIGPYVIFGQVVKGQEIADAISELPSQPGSGVALQPVKLKSVEIVENWPAKAGASSDSASTGTASADNKSTSPQ